MANQPIKVSEANLLTAAYREYMTGLGVDINQQTQSVSFTATALTTWLAEVTPLMDELRVFLGVYTKTDPNPGRITTILWPYKNGKPSVLPGVEGNGLEDDPKYVLPFNMGTGNP